MADALPPTLSRRAMSVRIGVAAVSVLTASAVLVALCTPDQRSVALPALAIVIIALLFVFVLWNRERHLPLFEVGTMVVAATALYSAYPLVAFLAARMQWTTLSDYRLLVYYPSPADFGGFAWRHVTYLVSFATVYLVVRGKATATGQPVRPPRSATGWALLLVFGMLSLYFLALRALYGVDYWTPYKDIAESQSAVAALPYVAQQLSHNLAGMLLVAKQGLLAFLFLRWRSWRWRLVLLAWLTIEILTTVARMGARTDLVLLLLAALLLYHRLVRPLTARAAAAAGGLILAGFVAFGLLRQQVTSNQSASFGLSDTDWSAANEFQALYATSYDLYVRRVSGTLGAVPWQIYASDLYLPIPSQLLPFEKIDPCDWYLDVLRGGNRGVGFMFGVISQAVVGLDWFELVARGALLAIVLALIHRWCARHAGSFWVLMLYIFICSWAHYTFRATTFYAAYYVLYRFLPTMLAVAALSAVIRLARTRRIPGV